MDIKPSIAYVNMYFPPFRGAGAVRAKSFVDFFVKHDYNVTVYAPKNSDTSRKYKLVSILFPTATNKDGIAKRTLFELFYGLELFFRVLFGQKKEYAMLSSPSFIVTFMASMAFSIKGAKTIIDVRDMYPEVLFKLDIISKDSLLGKLLSKMEQYLYAKAYKVLVVTESYEKIVSEKIDKRKVLLLRNGFDEMLFVPSEKKHAHFTLCYHGNLGKIYDVALLVRIFEQLNQKNSGIKFLVIGNGVNDHLLKKKIDNLTYIEHLKHEELASHISQCHLGLSATIDNEFTKFALPVKVYEYIGVGIPALVIPKGEAGALVEAFGLGYQFRNDEIDRIVDCIIDLKNTQNTYDAMVSHIVSERYNFTREFQLDKLLKYLI